MEAIAQKEATTIEDLPIDALRQIVIRVGGPPNGAVDVARTFAVYNIFGKFLEDKEVLRAVSFKDCVSLCNGQEMVSRSSDVASAYEKFQRLGGLLVKCAKAGNPEAEFMLAKVVMVSTSRLLNNEHVENLLKAQVSLLLSQRFGFRKIDHNKTMVAEASTFIKHFSPVTDNEMAHPDPWVHFDLVSNFLSKAKVTDLCEMVPYLKDYVTYNLVPGKEAEHKQFMTTLNEVCLRLEKASDPELAKHFEYLRAVCNKAHQVFRDLGIFDEEQLRPLQGSLVQANNRLTHKALLDCWSMLIPMLELAGPLAEHRGFAEKELISGIHVTALKFWGFFAIIFADMEILQNANLILTSKFHNIFYSK